ncbi:laminin subunit beta-1 [Macrosteles quadrilineatus]|uniref:laminin subunit beta-1 n=1 Tax=Macrosteles quadrilineatus TaxID=74068 RepID=UPI0023E2D6A5|nr:laminin subunit beta-1 [Macrosteles quadrilineatus]XP_054279345.1 laminin subunit beta-1 [Macrosteles quadrilineatus]
MAVAAYQMYLISATILITFTSINAQGPWDNRQLNYSRAHQRHSPCERSSCYPATGNLLIGRESKLWASSTCGLKGHKERYCIVSHLEHQGEERKKCFWCDSMAQTSNNPLLNHRIENIVYRKKPGTEKRSWWQSENGVENVTIQLDLEAEFHFTHLIITFKTFRPAAMLIERSYDFGKTWQVYRYFAQNCDESFPGISKDPQRSLTEVVCDSRYSSVAPSTDGEIIMRVLSPNLQHLYNDIYSQEVQNLLKMTNLRINFTKLHTLGDDLLDERQEIKEKYYYAIYEMVVRGSCSCYGHASRCLPIDGSDLRADMVHGKCECTHNTKGWNCEACEDFYNDLPWKPAGKDPNACKRCNCNNHATSCHFDAAVYELTGRVSGGVCDNCMHNTMGRNCEQCKQFFYRDPNLDFSDPEVCQPCNCDPGGSLDEGICDSYTDEASDLVSGRCHCKTNVDGRRCDTCKNGFWNFDENNPEGCQSCTCNTEGTINNQGCNQVTGECTCKRYVVGRDCNQCLPEYWGLSDIQDGCKPCDCDMGGAYDNNCDVITGQCRCRPYLTGRTCSSPDQSYFVGQIDHLTLEAETANCTSNCQVEIREPYRPPQETTWTGPGFMLARPGADLEFVVDNIKTSMEYDIVIRYEPKMAGEWKQVEMTIERPSPVDPNGPCANSRPEDDHKTVALSSDARYIVSPTPTCLEAGKTYKIKLMFKPDPPHSAAPSASILVDSIVLLPSMQSIPFFIGSPAAEMRKEQYLHYRCGSAFFTVTKGPVPDICKSYHYSIGSHVYGGALSCDCDPTGSVSNLCDQLGGRCQCKPNVVGRRCDHCAPGTYGFGPEGCKACDCNSVSALDNFCDVASGQCKCQAQTYGRACDQCQPGYWNYPKCQRCQCNGHADTCDPRTGACDTCRDFTVGHNCDKCIEGYYGDPSFSGDIPCRPCPCPKTIESGHSFADHCELDPLSQDVICECDDGYAGTRCDVCADNYYGNPKEIGGSCTLCNCSNNIDISRPGNCDPLSGKCLQCLFNTDGENCERCKENYYGDAINHLCTECVCNILGTNKSAGPCDGTTGQCPCLPNVIGLTCDTCQENHWKIASGMGCEPCDCDLNGSYSKQCNQYDGQCECKPGFGGRQCDQCQANHWGDPNLECKACECDPEGSAVMQCDRVNGSCICHPGIGGYKCDVCARGYLGTAPHCSPCGECFDNWDLILNQLAEQTEKVILAAGEIKRTGATGAYTQEFDRMEKQLSDIKQLLQNTTKSSVDLEHIDAFVEQLRDKLKNSQNQLNDVGKIQENTTQRIYSSNLALANLRNKVNVLKESTTALKANATHLQESNVEGALNLTREAAENSRRTQAKGVETEAEIVKAERQCKRTDALVGRTSSQFTQGQQDNAQTAHKLDEDISQLEKTIPDLNEQVCYKRGDPCDQLCGGAGCGFCGGISCEEGAFTKSSKAYSFATDAENKIYEKEAKAEELFRGISQARAEAVAAKEVATEALTAATFTQDRTEDTAQQCSDLILRLQHFLDNSGVTSDEIQDLAQKTQEKNIQLQPEQITELARNINATVASITDINKILADTAGDLTTAQRLKAQADSAKADAENVESTAQEFLDTLKEAETTQQEIQLAIDKADEDIAQAKIDLTQITSETAEAQQKANETVTEVNQLQERVKSLQTGFLKNQKDAQEVKAEAETMTEEVKRAEKRAKEMQDEYSRAVNSLQDRTEDSGLAQAKAQKLLEKASQLSLNTTDKLKQLKDAEKLYREQENDLTSLTDAIKGLNSRMGEYLMDINKKSTYYRICMN